MLPEFGGYCAYGLSKGKLIHSDPKAWTIKDGNLYLNKNMDVRKIV